MKYQRARLRNIDFRLFCVSESSGSFAASDLVLAVPVDIEKADEVGPGGNLVLLQ